MQLPCSIDNCGKPSHGHAMCKKHYLRWYNHGDPRYERLTTHACKIEGCDKPPRSRIATFCEMHYGRIRRNGDPHMLIDMRREDTKYRAAHTRIQRDRGKAASYACVDCGVQAHHWSYNHSDPSELHSDGGQAYSLDPTFYDPRCASCHAVFDGTGANGYTVGRSTR